MRNEWSIEAFEKVLFCGKAKEEQRQLRNGTARAKSTMTLEGRRKNVSQLRKHQRSLWLGCLLEAFQYFKSTKRHPNRRVQSVCCSLDCSTAFDEELHFQKIQSLYVFFRFAGPSAFRILYFFLLPKSAHCLAAILGRVASEAKGTSLNCPGKRVLFFRAYVKVWASFLGS